MLQLWTSGANIAKDIAAAVGSTITAVAIIVGGIWSYRRFGQTREREAKLSIKLSYTFIPYNPAHLDHSKRYIVSFDVTLANRGTTKLTAKRKRCNAYEDRPAETLKYSCNLLLRPVSDELKLFDKVEWFDSDEKSPRPGDQELDLVYEYEKNNETDFWLEPGETYHVGAAIILEPGTFLVLITFVGNDSDDDFWRRSFVIEVPGPPSPDRSGKPSA